MGHKSPAQFIYMTTEVKTPLRESNVRAPASVDLWEYMMPWLDIVSAYAQTCVTSLFGLLDTLVFFLV